MVGCRSHASCVMAVIDGTSINLLAVTEAGSVRGFTGVNPMPAACVGSTCGLHLDGGATFSALDGGTTLTGGVDAGTLLTTSVDATLPLQLRMLGSSPIVVRLRLARARLTGLSADGITSGVLAGAVTQGEIDTVLYPALVSSYAAKISRDCVPVPPNCGCAASSSGAALLGLFDAPPRDCVVTVDELRTNSLWQALFAPDVMLPDGTMALSLGLGITAVKASFVEP